MDALTGQTILRVGGGDTELWALGMKGTLSGLLQGPVMNGTNKLGFLLWCVLPGDLYLQGDNGAKWFWWGGQGVLQNK